jgi:hypothetical protein
VSKDNPRSDKWAEWYTFHTNVVATWGEANGREPPHEWLCPYNESRPTRPEESLFPDEPLPVSDPRSRCWCNAFCGFCDHHTDHHTYSGERDTPTPCTQCTSGICPDGPA